MSGVEQRVPFALRDNLFWRVVGSRRFVRCVLGLAYVGYAVSTVAALVGRDPSLWRAMMRGALLGLTIGVHIIIRKTWRRADARAAEIARLTTPQACEICGSMQTLRMNSMWFCSDHLDEGVHRTIKLVAMGKAVPYEVQERAERHMRDALHSALSGIDFDLRRLRDDSEGEQ